MEDVKGWLTQRAREDRRLYRLHGKPLEKDHKGKYLAIGPDGKTILGDDAADILQQSIKEFGSGTFALAKVGYPVFGQWLNLSA